jgi:hypothetical protein
MLLILCTLLTACITKHIKRGRSLIESNSMVKGNFRCSLPVNVHYSIISTSQEQLSAWMKNHISDLYLCGHKMFTLMITQNSRNLTCLHVKNKNIAIKRWCSNILPIASNLHIPRIGHVADVIQIILGVLQLLDSFKLEQISFADGVGKFVYSHSVRNRVYVSESLLILLSSASKVSTPRVNK